MTVRLLPALLLLSGCAVGDAIGTGFAAVGDGAKYVIRKVDDQATGTPDASAPSPGRETPPPGSPARGPAIEPAPVAPIEVEPLI